MNINDLENIERRLALVLPDAYREVLLKGLTIGGDSPDPYVHQDPRELLIRNLELRMGPREDSFCGARWPKNYICIGEDGFGNFYCIAADDSSCAVRFFDHEADSFEILSNSLPEYFSQLSKLCGGVVEIGGPRPNLPIVTTKASPSRDPAIARTDNRRESVLNPISMAEWTSFVESDSDLEMRGYRTMLNPFTGEETRLDYPGLAVLRGKKPVQVFILIFGRVIAERPGRAALAKLKQAAAALDARLMTDS